MGDPVSSLGPAFMRSVHVELTIASAVFKPINFHDITSLISREIHRT